MSSYWPIIEMSVSSIFLDPKNIRLPDFSASQEAIIQDMFANEDVFDLVKIIAKEGVFQDEFPVIIKEGKKVIVLEGNRRLCAFKALNEPSLVPAFRDKIIALKHDGYAKIRVTVAPDREAAEKLIANKHTVNTRRPWKPLRQAYFYKSQIDNGKTVAQISNDYPGIDIPRFIKMLEMHHIAKSFVYGSVVDSIVHNERRFTITNLERMYNDSYVANTIGLYFNESGKANINGIEFFKKAFSHIVRDVATNVIDSRKYNTDAQRKEYIDKLVILYRPAEQKSGEDKKQDEATSKNSKIKGAKDLKEGVKSHTSKDFKEKKVTSKSKQVSTKKGKVKTGLIPDYIEFGLENSSLEILYTELKNIPVADFANATHDLLRSFLEGTLAYFLKQTGEFASLQKGPRHNPKLGEMLSYIMSDGCTSITDSNLKAIIEQVKTGYNMEYSLIRMNMINHNESWVSTESDVRAAWSKLEQLFKIILQEPKK